jgi:hypothetical protein
MKISKRNACWIVLKKSEGKGTLGRYMHKLEDNIKMGNEEV